MKEKESKNNSLGVDHYLQNLPEDQKEALEKLRQTIKTLVPDVQEYLSYKMPAYNYHGMIGGFAAFKNHCSFFPWDSKTVEQFKDELTGFKTSTGTIQFTPEKPIPEELITKIIMARVKANLDKK
jgi:uncharacterized protein YdhG (YjbR/CyaY superfamily)|nr:DUF1801 domain-containing protein [uncultured Flavobacterium sp.]